MSSRRAEQLVKNGFLPIREQFLSVAEKEEENDDDGEAIAAAAAQQGRNEVKKASERPLLRSNKNGLRQGAKSQKQRKREKYLAMRNDLCSFVAVGKECPFQSTTCECSHDAEKYVEARRREEGFGGGRCFVVVGGGEDGEDGGGAKCPYEMKMKHVKCPFGIRCYYSDRHENVDDSKETKTLLEWRRSEGSEEFNAMEDRLQKALRESTYNLPRSTKYLETVGSDLLCVSKAKKRKITAMNRNSKRDDDANDANENEEEKIEKNRIDFNKKLVLAPLTTVGHAPFRRMCVKFGADVTISEMAMASNLLAGDRREWALLRRHACESSKTNKFGVQICGGYPDLVSRCVELIENEVQCDFIDINMGCPIEGVCAKGAGSTLLTQLKTGKLEKIIDAASSSLRKIPLTIKIRMGYHDRKQQWNAHDIVNRCCSASSSTSRDSLNAGWLGKVAAITLHGRTRAQRYSRLADWEYIDECGKIAKTVSNSAVPLIGNGDVYTFEDYNAHVESGNVATCMIGRGAIIKPWLFQEIKEQRHIDVSSSERLEYFAEFCKYGIEHWGSDAIGVEKTRTFLCEWMSYTHRYVPVGLLEHPGVQKMHLRPQRYFGRDDMETLLASDKVEDWIKVSEMFLGKPKDNWTFVPKHKSNSYVAVNSNTVTSWEEVDAQG